MSKAVVLITKQSPTNAKFADIDGYTLVILDVLDYWGLSAWLKENSDVEYDYRDYVDIRKKFLDIPEGEDIEDAWKYYEPMERAAWKLKGQKTKLQGKYLQRIKHELINGVYALSTDFYIYWIESMRDFAKEVRKHNAKISIKEFNWSLSETQEDWDVSGITVRNNKL